MLADEGAVRSTAPQDVETTFKSAFVASSWWAQPSGRGTPSLINWFDRLVARISYRFMASVTGDAYVAVGGEVAPGHFRHADGHGLSTLTY